MPCYAMLCYVMLGKLRAHNQDCYFRLTMFNATSEGCMAANFVCILGRFKNHLHQILETIAQKPAVRSGERSGESPASTGLLMKWARRLDP